MEIRKPSGIHVPEMPSEPQQSAKSDLGKNLSLRDVFENSSVANQRFGKNNYFSGRLLTAESLTEEQNYKTGKMAAVFDLFRRYSAVLLQQGRVQTDNDWNESSGKRNCIRESASHLIHPDDDD